MLKMYMGGKLLSEIKSMYVDDTEWRGRIIV